MKQTNRPSIPARTVLTFLGVFLPVFLIILATAIAGYRLQLRAEADLAEQNESLLINFQATLISNRLNSALEDMKYLVAPTQPLRELVATGDSAAWHEGTERFASFLGRRSDYRSVRVFDDLGNELIRVEYRDDVVEPLAEDELSTLRGAYYMQYTRSLEPGSVFVSRIMLSRGELPVIRLIAPLRLDGAREGGGRTERDGTLGTAETPEGTEPDHGARRTPGDPLRYYVELVYDGSGLLDTIRNAASMSIGETMLLNSLGYWLLSPDAQEEFGFLDPAGLSQTFAVRHEAVWREVVRTDHGVSRTPEGVFVYRTVYPVLDPHAGRRASDWKVVYDPGPFGMFADEDGEGQDLHWYLISFVPRERIAEQVSSFRSRLLFVTLVVTVLLAVVSFLLSVNRRRRMIAEAQVEEEASIFMNNPAPVIRIGKDGSVEKLNPAAVRIFDRAIAGARSEELLPSFDYASVVASDRRSPHQFEQRIGSRHFLFTVKRRTADRACTLYGSDITGIKDIEREIRRLSTAVEQSATAILITDLEGNITFANEACARSSGYTVDELIGRHTRVFKSGLQPAGVYSDLWATISAGAAWHGSLRNRKKTGEIYWEEVSISPLRTETDEVTGYLAVKEDITHRKAAEEQLRTAKEQAEATSRLKSEFLANMSHEIRTPMNAIIGFTDTLLDREEDEERRKHLGIIKRSGKHLLALINDILDFSKIEADKVKIERNAFAIERVIDHLQGLIGESVRRKGLSFTVAIEESVPSVISGDEHRITQVLLNVLTNAVKFTDTGSIALRCRYIEGELAIDISDTGEGIASEKLESIFSAFEQVNSTAERAHGGTGLGLAITKRLVELMNGRIDVESEVGRGSTFHIRLPAPVPGGVEPVELEEEIPDEHEGLGMTERWLSAMGSDELLRGVLRKAIRDLPDKLDKLESAHTTGDSEELLRVAHSLKGYSGNLGMQEVYAVVKELHDRLRQEDASPGFVDAMLRDLRSVIERIPAYYLKEAVVDSPADRSEEPAAAEGLRVLTAEDNEANRDLIRVLLDGLGVESELVANGREVLEALRRERFDVLLLDMQMPVMDGMETLHEIRSRSVYDDLHIIAITAHAMAGDEERYLRHGCNDYLSKPIDRAEFRRKIRELRSSRDSSDRPS